MNDIADEELMLRTSKGDRDAFTLLVHRHIDRLFSYALRLCGTPVLAEDLVQDTWLAAWQHAASFNRRKASVSTWLHRILHNKFIDTARKRQPVADDAALANIADPFDQALQHDQDRQLANLSKLIQKLPTNQKAAIVLTHFQGFSNREVAQILKLGLRATESLLARARKSLQQHLVEDEATTANNVSSNQARSL